MYVYVYMYIHMFPQACGFKPFVLSKALLSSIWCCFVPMARAVSESSLPPDLVVKSILPNGWCFYDCVREHLHCDAADGELVLSTSGVAALCLSSLALCRKRDSFLVQF